MAYAAKTTFYKSWNFMTGGFLGRQDYRRYKYDRDQISESEFNGGTIFDAGVSIVASATGGAVGSKFAGRLGGGVTAKVAGAAVGNAFEEATNQSGQVLTHAATDGKLGQERLNIAGIGMAVATGTVVSGSVALRGSRIGVSVSSATKTSATFIKEGAGKVGVVAKRVTTTATTKVNETLRNGVLSAKLRMTAVNPNLVSKARGNGSAVGYRSASSRLPDYKRYGGDLSSVGAKSVAPAKRTSNQTVLGHYPDYVKVSDKLGARRFEIPETVWNKMSPAEEWGANKKFLDRMILKRDEVILATPAGQARSGSFYARELDYLKSQGYRLNSEGTKMLPYKR